MSDSSHRSMLISSAQSTALYAVSNVCGQLIEGWRHQPLPQLVRFSWPEFVRFVVATSLLNPPCFYWQWWLERRWPGEEHEAAALGRGTYEVVGQGVEMDDLEGVGSSGRAAGRGRGSLGADADENDDDDDDDDDVPRRGGGAAESRLRRRSSADGKAHSGTAPPAPAATAAAARRPPGTASRLRSWLKAKGGMRWRNILVKWALDNTVGGLWYSVGFILFIEMLKFKGWKAIGDAMANDLGPLLFTGAFIWAAATLFNFVFVPVEKRVVFLAFIGLFWGIYLSIFEAEPEQEQAAKSAG